MGNEIYEYEKVVDNIYWLGYNIILNFSVVLGKSYEGNRKSYHQE